MAQGVVARGGELEALGLLAPTARGTTALSTLLAQEEVGLETPHLELGVQAEEGTPTTDEAIARTHRDAPHLDELDDVILLTLEGQAELLRVEVKGGSGVVVQPRLELRPERSLHTSLDLLLEVEVGLLACALW